MKMKVEHFHVYDLVPVCFDCAIERNTMHKIPGTSAIYWVV